MLADSEALVGPTGSRHSRASTISSREDCADCSTWGGATNGQGSLSSSDILHVPACLRVSNASTRPAR
jgi:hypothetical protein